MTSPKIALAIASLKEETDLERRQSPKKPFLKRLMCLLLGHTWGNPVKGKNGKARFAQRQTCSRCCAELYTYCGGIAGNYFVGDPPTVTFKGGLMSGRITYVFLEDNHD